MKKIQLQIPSIILFFFIVCSVQSQIIPSEQQAEMPDMRVGITGIYQSINHNANFSGADVAHSCCGNYTSLSNGSMVIGLFAEKPLSNLFSIQFRSAYLTMPATFKANEFIGYSQKLNPSTKKSDLVPVRSDFTLATNLAFLTITPQFVIEPIQYPLRVQVGGDVGYVVGKTYSQTEILAQEALNSGVRFADGSTSFNTKNNSDLTLASSLFLAIRGSLSYRYDISPEFSVMPEVGYLLGLTNFAPIGTWRQNGAFGGLSFAYNIGVKEKIIDKGTVVCSGGKIYNTNTTQCECPPGTQDENGNCVNDFTKNIGMHSVQVASTRDLDKAKKVVEKLLEVGFTSSTIETKEGARFTEYIIWVKDVGNTMATVNQQRDKIMDAIDSYCRSLEILPTFDRQKNEK